VPGVPHGVTVTRAGGIQGDVGVDVLIFPPGETVPQTHHLDWANGDGSAKSFTVQLDLAGSGGWLQTAHLKLANATGGAAISSMPLVVYVFLPPPPLLQDFINSILFLAAQGLSPAWLLALAGPAAVLAARRRSQGQRGAGRGSSVRPATTPPREP
jgi:hypothetical protein